MFGFFYFYWTCDAGSRGSASHHLQCGSRPLSRAAPDRVLGRAPGRKARKCANAGEGQSPEASLARGKGKAWTLRLRRRGKARCFTYIAGRRKTKSCMRRNAIKVAGGTAIPGAFLLEYHCRAKRVCRGDQTCHQLLFGRFHHVYERDF
jgi:hypothetical protein